MLAGKITFVRELQPSAIPDPISVRLLGRVSDFNEVQPLKTLLPIFFKLSGKLIEVRDLSPSKAFSFIEVTPSGMVKSVISSPFK